MKENGVEGGAEVLRERWGEQDGKGMDGERDGGEQGCS